MNLLDANDRPGEYPPSWYADTANRRLDLPRLIEDIRCQVCVVGGGYSGLSAALHLARAGRDVALVEAQRVGWGASGRNGGQLGSGQRRGQDELRDMLGREHARSLWRLGEDAKALVHGLIGEHGIDCDYRAGILYANHRRRLGPHTRAYADLLRDEYGYEAVRFVDSGEIGAMVGTRAYFSGLLDTGAGHLHPLNYALGLAQAADGAGARLYERSRVTAIENGKRVRIVTDAGTVNADHLILACNGYLGGLERSVAARVMPINNFIVATEPLGDDLAKQLIRDDVAVSDSRYVVNYFRLSADRRLLFGGGETYGYRFPADIKAFVRKPMLKIYPQLADARIDYGWGGTLAITMSRLPYFARPADNIWSVSGYSGHGVALATLAGALVADEVEGRSERFEQFARLPARRFPGGAVLRWPLLVLAMGYHAMLDRL